MPSFDPLITPSPYDEDTEDRNGRFVVQSTPLSFFNTGTAAAPGGVDRTIPYPDEWAHDDDDNAIYILTRDPKTNAVVPKSHSKELEARINQYENSGIFDNATAFTFNKEIYRLYFDSDREAVRQASDLTFSPNFRYYAIRGFNPVDGAPNYYTGIINSETDELITNLVDMDVKEDIVTKKQYSVMAIGHLIQNLTHTHQYVVEFYDAEQLLMEMKTFQAIGVRNMVFDKTPESAIRSIKVMTNYPYEGDPWKCKIPQGASWEHLGLRVYVEYAGDANYREITHEVASGKLTINGLEDLDTSELTSVSGKPHEITISYLISQAKVEGSVGVTNGQYSIDKTLQVYVVQNDADVPYNLLFAAWVDSFGGARHVNMKLFGFYATGPTNDIGVLRDITGLLKNSVLTNFEGYSSEKNYFIGNGGTVTGTTQTFNVAVPYGFGLSQNFAINYLASIDNNNNKVKFSLGSDAVKNYRTIDFVQATRKFRLNAATSLFSQLMSEFTYSQGHTGAIVPTHIRIRSAVTPNVIYRDLYQIENINSVFDAQNAINPEYPLLEESPLIIEFVHVYTADGGQTIESTVTTGAALFYVHLATS